MYYIGVQYQSELGCAMELGDKVKELRQNLGWTQVTLAEKAGVTHATISRIESGKVVQPMMNHLRNLAEALGVSVDYLSGKSAQMFSDEPQYDKQVHTIFRGWGKLSQTKRQELVNFARFLEQQDEEEGKEYP